MTYPQCLPTKFSSLPTSPLPFTKKVVKENLKDYNSGRISRKPRLISEIKIRYGGEQFKGSLSDVKKFFLNKVQSILLKTQDIIVPFDWLINQMMQDTDKIENHYFSTQMVILDGYTRREYTIPHIGYRDTAGLLNGFTDFLQFMFGVTRSNLNTNVNLQSGQPTQMYLLLENYNPHQVVPQEINSLLLVQQRISDIIYEVIRSAEIIDVSFRGELRNGSLITMGAILNFITEKLMEKLDIQIYWKIIFLLFQKESPSDMRDNSFAAPTQEGTP